MDTVVAAVAVIIIVSDVAVGNIVCNKSHSKILYKISLIKDYEISVLMSHGIL